MLYKTIKQAGAFAFAFAAMMAYLLSERPSELIESVSSEEKDTVQIVLLDQDDDCVPFTLLCNNDTLEQKVMFAVETMKTNQNRVPMFYGYLPAETKVHSVTFLEDVMRVDFNSAFLEIEPAKQIRALEAICFVFTQFDEVDKFELSVEGNRVEHFANGNIEIKQPLDSSLLLNNFETTDAFLHRSNAVSIAYTKEQEGVNYMTLQTIRSHDTAIECIEKYYTRRDSVLIKDRCKFKEISLNLIEKTMYADFSSEILTPLKNCDFDLIFPVLLTIKENFDIETIEVSVKGVHVATVKASELSFNPIG